MEYDEMGGPTNMRCLYPHLHCGRLWGWASVLLQTDKSESRYNQAS